MVWSHLHTLSLMLGIPVCLPGPGLLRSTVCVNTAKGLTSYCSRESMVTQTTNQARYTLWFAKQINYEELPPFWRNNQQSHNCLSSSLDGVVL